MVTAPSQRGILTLMFDLYSFQHRLGVRLLGWSVPSMLIGGGLLFTGLPLLHGIGVQALIWGAIDAALAVSGIVGAVRGSRAYPDETGTIRKTMRLRRILRINTYLDVLYVAIGIALPLLFGADAFLLGNGIGVVIQGLFLFVFDLVHAQRLPATPPPWYDPTP